MTLDDQLDLRRYLSVLLRRRWIVIGVLVLICASWVSLTVRQSDQYRASAVLLLRSSSSEALLGSPDAVVRARNAVATEIGLIESGLVREQVEQELGRPARVRVLPRGDTDLLAISAVSTDPNEAALVVNTYAEVYIEWKRQSTIDELLKAQETVQNEVAQLELQLAALEEPIVALQEELLEARGTQQSVLEERLAELRTLTQVERVSLEGQVALYRQQISELQVSRNVTQTGGVQLVTRASVPSQPFAPDVPRAVLLSLLFGGVVAVAAAVVVEALDNRVRSAEELEDLVGLPVLGFIPEVERPRGVERTDATDKIALTNSDSSPAEAFRVLRTTLQFVALDRPLRSIQVTSAIPGEGKSMTAANLAASLAQVGRRVLLVDADLRRPRLHSIFDTANDVGFTSILLGEASPAAAFRPTSDPNLFVLPAGPIPPNPSELLAQRRTAELFERLMAQCDVMVVDSAPALAVPDPLVVSGYVDGVLVVMDSRRAKVQDVKRMAVVLGQVNAPILGWVVNRLGRDEAAAGYAYRTDYVANPAPARSWGRRLRKSSGASVEPSATAGTDPATDHIVDTVR